MDASKEGRFRFRVNSAFILTGRGTTVLGYIEGAVVRFGDSLLFGPRRVICKGVEMVREATWTHVVVRVDSGRGDSDYHAHHNRIADEGKEGSPYHVT